MRLKSPVQAVRRDDGGVQVKAVGGEWEAFDQVIFGTHSDDTLALLADPTTEERSALSAIKYQPNEITLHADKDIMPKRSQTWSSWVYTEDETVSGDQIDLTYWMNSLQPIPTDDPHFVTLNTKRTIREELIYDQVTLRHPVYDLAALAAQEKVREMNGANNTWFTGAWLRHGFHEDGLESAVTVSAAIKARYTETDMIT
jgi:predicted NAD/FAD-binding protein